MMRPVLGWTAGFPDMEVSRCRARPVPHDGRIERVFRSLLLMGARIVVSVVRTV